MLSLLWSPWSHRDKYPLLHTILNVSFCSFVGSLIVTPPNDGLSMLQNHKPSIHPTLQEAQAVHYRRGLSLTVTSLWICPAKCRQRAEGDFLPQKRTRMFSLWWCACLLYYARPLWTLSLRFYVVEGHRLFADDGPMQQKAWVRRCSYTQ